MHHLALALVVIATVLAGSVWYFPAVQTLRAGRDRPRSARLNAAACLAWWGTGPMAAAALLFTTIPVATSFLCLGGLVATGLRLGAVRARHRERCYKNGMLVDFGQISRMSASPWRQPPVLLIWAFTATAVGSTAALLFAAAGVPAAAVLSTLAAAIAAVVAARTIARHLAQDLAPGAFVSPLTRLPLTHPSRQRRQSR